MLDLKIIDGKIIDVQNRRIIEGDLGIKDGAIVSVGSAGDAKRVIDAAGRFVSPGFVDIHMHEEDLSATGPGGRDISLAMLAMGVTTACTGNCGNNRQDPLVLKADIDRFGNPVNYVSYIGHNYLRSVVGIEDRYAKAGDAQIEKMRTLAAKAVEDGAIGLSYGLEYSPGVDFDEAERVGSLLRSRKDILLSAHYRKDAKYALDAITEMCLLGKALDIPFQISHLSSCCAYGNMTEALALIDELALGTDVQVDAYPYDAFSTYIGSAVFDDGCFELWNKDYSSVQLTADPFRNVYCDKEIFERARREYPNMLAIAHVMKEDEIIQALKHPLVMVASDGIFYNHQGHPRGAGTFPRVLGRYVRQRGDLNLFEAIFKMTQMPAKRLGFTRKGTLDEGMDADIVIFNGDTVIDNASFDNQQLPPTGIDFVLIGGEVAVDNAKLVNTTLGKCITRSMR